MTITINGEARDFEAARFAAVTDLLEELELAGHPVLVELNGRALLKQELANHEIKHGDQIEIVRMVAGG